MMTVNVYGAGIIAQGCYLALSDRKPILKVLKRTKREPKFYKCYSEFREDPIVGSHNRYGLSKFYHGVTPTTVFRDPTNQTALSQLFKMEEMNFPDKYNFVPRAVPRPKVKPEYAWEAVLSEYTVFAMSVFGNLSELINKGFAQEFSIDDDVVMAIGEIDFASGLLHFGEKLNLKNGVLFPYKVIDGVQITLRPIFDEYANIDFVSAAENFIDLDMKKFKEKALTATYLRFGLQLHQIKRWKVFLQMNLENAYILKNESITEDSFLLDRISSKLERTKESLREFLPKIEFDSDTKYVNGIHLSYNRQQLEKVPRNIFVADTSLNPCKALHPSIASYCEAYKFCNEDFCV